MSTRASLCSSCSLTTVYILYVDRGHQRTSTLLFTIRVIPQDFSSGARSQRCVTERSFHSNSLPPLSHRVVARTACPIEMTNCIERAFIRVDQRLRIPLHPPQIWCMSQSRRTGSWVLRSLTPFEVCSGLLVRKVLSQLFCERGVREFTGDRSRNIGQVHPAHKLSNLVMRRLSFFHSVIVEFLVKKAVASFRTA